MYLITQWVVGQLVLGAKDLNRRFIGIEKEKEYYNIAVDDVFWFALPLTKII